MIIFSHLHRISVITKRGLSSGGWERPAEAGEVEGTSMLGLRLNLACVLGDMLGA